MGMDSYLYKTSKSEYSNYEEYKKNYEENPTKYENEYYDDSTTKELCYWRKPYGMHSYICDNFLADGEDDNCNRIPLSRDNLKQMLKEMKRCLKNYSDGNPVNLFGEDDYWNYEKLKHTIKVFNDVIKSYDEDTVIYYYSWY